MGYLPALWKMAILAYYLENLYNKVFCGVTNEQILI